MEEKTFSGKNVPISVVASILHKDKQFIRISLQRGLLPIGFALRKPNSSQYTYYVSPKQLFEYSGYYYNEDDK